MKIPNRWPWLVAFLALAGVALGGFFLGRLLGPGRLSSGERAPLIGIASLTSENYVRAIRAAGGIPVVLPNTDGSDESVAEYLERLDGLLLPGGADIPPSEYGEEAHESVEPLSEERYRFEKALVAAWMERTDKPLFGICLGSQWIAVASGGTLIQDLPTERQVNHRDTTHRVSISDGSRLAKILGAGELEVNSFHHQAADTLGGSLRAVAESEDGVIEAVETTDPDRFLIGVQWHPEKMVPGDATQAKLLKAFVEAAVGGRP